MSIDNFTCQSCGNCCRVSGYVHLDDKEVHCIARYLQMPKREFVDRFTCLTRNRQGLSLTEKNDGLCVFLEENTCSIYPVRPHQCRTFPFKWQFSDAKEVCPGVASFF